jgi:hypothetical protein
VLQIEEHSGWLLSYVCRRGWLSHLSAEQAAVLATALTGFYKLVGVDLIREQVEAILAPECPRCSLEYDPRFGCPFDGVRVHGKQP